VLKGICGRTEASGKESAEHFGYAYCTTNWKGLIADPEFKSSRTTVPIMFTPNPALQRLKRVSTPLSIGALEADND